MIPGMERASMPRQLCANPCLLLSVISQHLGWMESCPLLVACRVLLQGRGVDSSVHFILFIALLLAPFG